MLRKAGRRGLQYLAQHAGLKFDKVAGDFRTRLFPVVNDRRIVSKLDADLREDPVGSRLDPEQVFFGQDVVCRDVAHDVGPAEPV